MEIINYETAEINERLARVDTLESRVSGLTGLKFVNSTAEMTDTTRTYVNAADGNWYEYSGGSWVSRGQYGGVQVDTELETEGAAADAKATGAEIGELKSEFTNIRSADLSFIAEMPNNLLTLRHEAWTSGEISLLGVDDYIFVNGTTEGNTIAVIASDVTLPAGTYTISASGRQLEKIFLQLYRVQDGSLSGYLAQTQTKATFILEEETTCRARLFMSANTTFENYAVCPLLENGETATPISAKDVNARDSIDLEATNRAAQDSLLSEEIADLKSALDYSDYDIAKNAVIVSGLYMSNTGVLVALSSGSSDRMVCIKALPNCIYRIKKNTSTVMRAGCLATDAPAASMGLVNFTSHTQASSDELSVQTGDTTIYIYIQLFAAGDTPDNINDNLASLQVIPDINANHKYDMAYKAAYDKANLVAITDGASTLLPLSNAGRSGGVTFDIYGDILCMNGSTTGVLVRNISEPMELAAGKYTLSNAGVDLPTGMNLQVRDVTGGGNVAVAQTRTNTIFTLDTATTCLVRIYIPAGAALVDAIARPVVIAGQKPPIYSANDRTVRNNAFLRLIGTQTQSFSASPVLSQGDNVGQTLTVMSYNVAHYNNDTSTEISGQLLLNFRRMLGRYNADIVGVQEDSIYLDDGQTKDSRTYLWNPLYPRKAGGTGPTIHAKQRITNTGTCKFTTGQYFVYGIITMGDNTVLVVSAHPVSHTHGSDEERASQYRELFQWCNGEIQLPLYPSGTLTSAPEHTHVIVCMDANSTEDTDKSNLALAVGDDYIMANGAIYGWFLTHFKGNRSAIDNIIVSKNIIVNDVECLEEWYDQLYSDHAPVVAKITLL